MRATVVFALALAGASIGAAPARAGQGPTEPLAWYAPLPCAWLCPQESAIPEGVLWACEKEPPFTAPQSFDDVRIAVPERSGTVVPKLLVAREVAGLNFDLFVCLVRSPGTPEEDYEFAARGRPAGGKCTTAIPFSECGEEATLAVAPGEVYVLRAYNLLSTPDATGDYYYVGPPAT